MKKANLYRLRVKFNTDHSWDVSIVAVNTNAVCMWITSENDSPKMHITDVHIELVQQDYESVKENHLAHALPPGTIKY